MEKLNKVMMNPSGWDSRANYMGDVPGDEWLVVMDWNRDSDILSESNRAEALAMLGGEGDDVHIFRLGHWACGWIEYLCVKAGSDKEAIGDDIRDQLDAYPVLNEDDYSERQDEEANRIWTECYNDHERLAYVREHRNQFEFHNYADLISCVRGKYFAGYASELVS